MYEPICKAIAGFRVNKQRKKQHKTACFTASNINERPVYFYQFIDVVYCYLKFDVDF